MRTLFEFHSYFFFFVESGVLLNDEIQFPKSQHNGFLLRKKYRTIKNCLIASSIPTDPRNDMFVFNSLPLYSFFLNLTSQIVFRISCSLIKNSPKSGSIWNLPTKKTIITVKLEKTLVSVITGGRLKNTLKLFPSWKNSLERWRVWTDK